MIEWVCDQHQLIKNIKHFLYFIFEKVALKRTFVNRVNLQIWVLLEVEQFPGCFGQFSWKWSSRKRWRQANSSILTATFYLKQLGNLKRVLKKQHIDDSKKTLRKTGLNKQNLSIRCLLYCKVSAVLHYELTWWVTLNLHSRITVGKNTPILMMIGQYWLLSVCW